MAVPDPCDLPVIGGTTVCKTAGVVKAVADFAQDPFGYIAQKLQESASGLATTVLPALEKITHPDLSMTWFLQAYRISFALAVLVWVIFLGWNFVQLSRRRISSDDLVESLAVYTPAFFLGVIFGPVAGTGLLVLTGALSNSLAGWGITGSVDATTAALQAAIAAGDKDQIAGGSIVAIAVFAALLIALLMVFTVLLIMAVTLYLSGAVFPLSVVWLVHPRQRSKGLRIAMVWLGVNGAHVLIFLLLGVALHMIGGLGDTFNDPGLQPLANLLIAVIALFLAVGAPFGLLAFAPVGPSSAPVGDPSPTRSTSTGGGADAVGGGYAEADDDSQTAQMARANEAMGEEGDEEMAATYSEAGPGAADGSPGGAGGGSSSAEMEAGEEPMGESGDGAADPGDAGTGSGGDGTDDVDPAQESDPGIEEQAGGGMAASVMGEVGAAAGMAAQMAQAAGEIATEQMEHGETGNEGSSHADARARR